MNSSQATGAIKTSVADGRKANQSAISLLQNHEDLARRLLEAYEDKDQAGV